MLTFASWHLNIKYFDQNKCQTHNIVGGEVVSFSGNLKCDNNKEQ